MTIEQAHRTDVHAHVVVRRADGFVLDVELDLPSGSTTALVGPNGAGKSTLVQALAGLVPLDGGHIRVADRLVADTDADIAVPASERHVGVVFQERLLFDHLTVLENVAFGPRSRGAGRGDARGVATDWLGRLGVADLGERRPAELSGGQAQRVSLARALATDPQLLLLDEPLSALDVQGRAALRRVLVSHLESLAIPRLLVTHDPVEAFLLADRLAVIEDGRLTQLGTPAEIRERPRTPYVADLVGTNLMQGTAAGGTVTVDEHPIQVADTDCSGPVLLVVHPHAIALSMDPPGGSPRNSWNASIQRVERIGDRVRVGLGGPVELTAEVTPAAVSELGIAPGLAVWVAIKATEIEVVPDA